MNEKCVAFWRRRTPAAFTLVEVLAALVILGTLVAGVVTARGRLTRQWSHAQRRMAALRAADAWMTAVASGNSSGQTSTDAVAMSSDAGSDVRGDQSPDRNGSLPWPPAGDNGMIETNPPMRWRITSVDDAQAQRLGVRKLRLEIVDQADDAHTTETVLATVEFLAATPGAGAGALPGAEATRAKE